MSTEAKVEGKVEEHEAGHTVIARAMTGEPYARQGYEDAVVAWAGGLATAKLPRDEADLMDACHHEAGHTVIAREYGAVAWFCVWRKSYGGENRAWTGAAYTRESYEGATLTPYQNAVVSWAGGLATAKLNGVDPAEIYEAVEMDWTWAITDISESDLVSIRDYASRPYANERKAFRRAVELVDRLWPVIQGEALVAVAKAKAKAKKRVA